MTKKPLTLEALLSEKKLTQPKKWTFDSTILGYTIQIDKISPTKISSIVKDMQDNTIDDYTGCQMLIYECVSLFRAKELLKKYSPVEPFEVVNDIFDCDMGEIYALGNQIAANYGLAEVKEDIKKQ